MPRLTHGRVVTAADVQTAQDLLADVQTARTQRAEGGTARALAPVVAVPSDLHDFDYLFPDLAADPDALLPESPATVAALKELGRAMADPDGLGPDSDSPIPAAYTYLGQFIDHDTTLEVVDHAQSGSMSTLLDPAMAPLPLGEIRNALRNIRTATLDLDSLYGFPAPRDPGNQAKMRLGRNSPTNDAEPPRARPHGKTDDNDLPRQPRSDEDAADRAALIGDPRNDENTIVSQLHLAFLKAHNALVAQGRSFEESRRILRQHYQHVVVEDFLKRVCDAQVVDNILSTGNEHFNTAVEPFFMPLEYAVAAYRFGHTMVRGGYDFNSNFRFDGPVGPATLELLFTFTALGGGFSPEPGVDFDTLPENWIIQWENIVGDGPAVGKARRLDTRLAKRGDDGADRALFRLVRLDGSPEADLAAFLSVRNLLRGYRLRVPTGQAVAARLGVTPLTPEQVADEAGTGAQRDALVAGGFDHRTPLWYYVLAEAGHFGGERLGPVGSRLVAEVLVGLVRRSEDSILRTPGWRPSLPSRVAGTFTLADLLAFAGVLDQPVTGPRLYTVQPGDTLRKIAREELGAEARWVEIFVLNRAIVRDPGVILVGQVLALPGATPMTPAPRIHVVRAGETLRKIAEATLGDADRFLEIFALNGDVLTHPDVVAVGQVLVLPAR